MIEGAGRVSQPFYKGRFGATLRTGRLTDDALDPSRIGWSAGRTGSPGPVGGRLGEGGAPPRGAGDLNGISPRGLFLRPSQPPLWRDKLLPPANFFLPYPSG